MSENNDGLGKFMKGLVTAIIVILVILVVGFGLLVGFCALIK